MLIRTAMALLGYRLKYSLLKWRTYGMDRINYSLSMTTKKVQMGALGSSPKEFNTELMKNFLFGKLTYLHGYEGDAMAPTVGVEREILLVRELPLSNFLFRLTCFVGDVVVLKDPENSKRSLVRRIVAVAGDEMVSVDEKDEAFILEENKCWVLADNKDMNFKEAKDSRTFGPIPAETIIGRVIYRFRSSEDHGSVENSDTVDFGDEVLLEFELNVDKMAKQSSEAGEQDYQ